MSKPDPLPDVPLGRKILFSTVAVVLALLLLEGAARLLLPSPDTPVHKEHERLIMVLGLPDLNDTMEFDPVLFWSLKPELRNLRVRGTIRRHPIDFSVTTHAGLRSPAPSKTKPALRVLALGDSCTFGLGVADDETWPAQLEALLREGGIDAEVVNAGVPGYTAFQGKRLLETRGRELRPDLVIVAFGFNDMDRGMPLSDLETARALSLRGWQEVLIQSRVAYHIKLLIDRATLPRPRRGGGKDGPPRLTEDEFYRALEEIRDRSTAQGAGMLVVVWPFEAQIRERSADLSHYQLTAARFCREQEVDGVNLVSAFLREDANLFIDHIHASAHGCGVAAQALRPWVEAWAARHGIVPREVDMERDVQLSR